jgi:transcriptional regulator with XRE-family HTH domain
MNCTQTLNSPLNIDQHSPVVVPIHLERAPPLHRLGDARRQEDVSRKSVARALGITVQDVRLQECATTDLPLSVLHKWAKVLGLPVCELVKEPDGSLSAPLLIRACLVRIMKSAMTILKRARNPRTKQLAQTMVDQLIEIMPELRGVSAWRAEGKSRRLDELGVTAEQSFSEDDFKDAVD